eukprot:Seg8918.1 transcript_id=Seg8918.1/GoldUCD/mRNA.D3Y31 product="Protein phosphatase 1K mitochondrial" protein_id=Seg8918.1/GoldUCD/D3Y31
MNPLQKSVGWFLKLYPRSYGVCSRTRSFVVQTHDRPNHNAIKKSGRSCCFATNASNLIQKQTTAKDVGSSCVQGKLKVNEDRYDLSELLPGVNYFAVFDGHRGDFAAEFLKRQLSEFLSQELKFYASHDGDIFEKHGREIISNTFNKSEHLLEVEVLASNFDQKQIEHIGTTAMVALLINKSKLLIAHTGDSRAVLSRSGNPLCLAEDHTPNNEEEVTRVEEAGGWIDWDTKLVPYVNGVLAMTRSFGNILLRSSGITHTPHIKLVDLDVDVDEFLVLCTDGVSDWMTDNELLSIVSEYDDPKESADALTCCARQYGSTDDATALVIPLDAWHKKQSIPSGSQSNFMRANILKRD